jgi:hypothetical protein
MMCRNVMLLVCYRRATDVLLTVPLMCHKSAATGRHRPQPAPPPPTCEELGPGVALVAVVLQQLERAPRVCVDVLAVLALHSVDLTVHPVC